MYAPQWVDIVENYLNWRGFKCAAWYFHAHTNESFSKEKQTIVAHYSSIEPVDFQNGAFDVAWFWEAYKMLGKDRFKVVYDAAKYVASAGQHRRAQLFSDAVTGNLDAAESEKIITEKRNKDRLLAYSLIPLKKKKDALKRYEFIQAFFKESKKYGAQRQESERTAVRIALDNLARNAGFADSSRFMWQMETDKLTEVAGLFKPTAIEGIEMQIVFSDNGQASVEISKNEKTLKDVPTKLKKHADVVRIKTVAKELKQQHSRARASWKTQYSADN